MMEEVRSSIHEFDLVKVCKKQKNQLLRDYSGNFKKCENPFKKQKKSVKTNLHEVTLDEFKHSLHNYCFTRSKAVSKVFCRVQ